MWLADLPPYCLTALLTCCLPLTLLLTTYYLHYLLLTPCGQVRKDIRDFKAANKLDKVIVLWTANTERFASLQSGVNDSADNLLQA